MLRLTVLSGARTGARFDVDQPVTKLGRAPDNDVVFDPNVDLDASAHHAEIRAEEARWVVVDLKSRNGVFLPNASMQRITRHVIVGAEVIQLGPQGPRIEIEVTAPPPSSWSSVVTEPQSRPPPVPNIEPPRPREVVAVGPPKRGKSTQEIKALVERNVQSATGRMRVVIAVLMAAVALSAITIVFLALRKEDPETLRKELDKLAMNDPRRKEIEKKLGDKTPENTDVGHDIYAGNENALFMLVAHHGKTYEKGGFCTAFAIKSRVLASNAHCVRAAEDFEDQGAEIYAHLNESSKKGIPKMLKVGRHKGHPAYRHNAQNITPDVGLFTLEDEDAATTVTIASKAELERLGTGDALYVLGFPGRTMDEDSPVAVFMFSHVGRITDEFGQKPDKFKDAWLVQHEGQTTPGTSGSPIFNGEGHVVAINAGGLLEQNQQAVYKYAMRIDLLEAIDLSSGAAQDGDDEDTNGDGASGDGSNGDSSNGDPTEGPSPSKKPKGKKKPKSNESADDGAAKPKKKELDDDDP